MDYERLSALLEGRVSGPEREALLAQLAASTDDFEAYTDTVEILMAVEEGEDARATAAENAAAGAVPEGVTPLRRPERGRRVARGWLLAACVATIALVSTLVLRGRGYAGAYPVQLAERADTGGAPLPEGLTAPWSTSRGEPGSARGDADAVRAGAMLLDLAVAVRARDTAEIQALAVQLRDRYDPGARSDTPLGRIAAHPRAPGDSLNALLVHATNRLASTLDSNDALELGLWLQGARLAAHYRNAEFFGEGDAGVMLERAERLARGNPNARAAVDSVGAALPASAPQRWDALQASLAVLLREIAS